MHGTSGYLPAQFLCSGTNRRTDRYGGSVEGRIRFPVEVLEAMVVEVGAGRVGLRICPGNPFNDLVDDRPEDVDETFRAFLAAIRPLGLAWLHVIRRHEGDPGVVMDNLALARELHDGALIANDSFDAAEAATSTADDEVARVNRALDEHDGRFTAATEALQRLQVERRDLNTEAEVREFLRRNPNSAKARKRLRQIRGQ